MVERHRSWSLRNRLLGYSFATAFVVWLLGAGATYAIALHETGESFDAAMQQTADLLLSFAQHEFSETGTTATPIVEPVSKEYPPYLHYQVWTRDRRLLLRSQSAPDRPLAADFRAGLRDQWVGDDTWRVFVADGPGALLQIQIGEPHRHRHEVEQRLIATLFLVFLAGLPALLATMWWIIRRVSADLERSSLEIGRRSPSELSPLSPQLLPVEFLPLIQSLNQLLARLSHALQAERRFTADASHELRTPLAVIKMQAQVASRARSPEAAAAALQKLDQGIDRATHLLEQLLSAARAGTVLSQAAIATHSLAAEIRELLEAYASKVQEKSLSVVTDCGDVDWTGPEPLLRIVLRNLIDNALHYTTPDGRIDIRCARLGDLVEVSVRDNGPGIAPENRARVFDRFYREPGAEVTGSGLGLAIVRDIVTLLGGEIAVTDGLEGRGVGFSVKLPPVGVASRPA